MSKSTEYVIVVSGSYKWNFDQQIVFDKLSEIVIPEGFHPKLVCSYCSAGAENDAIQFAKINKWEIVFFNIQSKILHKIEPNIYLLNLKLLLEIEQPHCILLFNKQNSPTVNNFDILCVQYCHGNFSRCEQFKKFICKNNVIISQKQYHPVITSSN